VYLKIVTTKFKTFINMAFKTAR